MLLAERWGPGRALRVPLGRPVWETRHEADAFQPRVEVHPHAERKPQRRGEGRPRAPGSEPQGRAPSGRGLESGVAPRSRGICDSADHSLSFSVWSSRGAGGDGAALSRAGCFRPGDGGWGGLGGVSLGGVPGARTPRGPLRAAHSFLVGRGERGRLTCNRTGASSGLSPSG